jgi:hypothetical protein
MAYTVDQPVLRDLFAHRVPENRSREAVTALLPHPLAVMLNFRLPSVGAGKYAVGVGGRPFAPHLGH